MTSLKCGCRLAIGVWALCVAGPGAAQENLDLGKTPAQLFASNCATCHKSADGLSKARGISELKDFLSEHYTASKQSAAAIAAYVAATDKAPAPSRPATPTERTPKGEPKSSDVKSGKSNLDWLK